MYDGKGRQKSFLQSFVWVGLMLLAMGVVFALVAVIMQLVPLSPGSISMYSNGVRQPATEETVRDFRLVFLLVFGIIGAGLMLAGGIVAGRVALKRARARRLKEDGVCIAAEVVEYTPSAVHVNYRLLTRIHCAYTEADGTTYIFKSDLLRMNPAPYLPQGKVNVYHDHGDIGRYFVDVDGSVGMGERVIEL